MTRKRIIIISLLLLSISAPLLLLRAYRLELIHKIVLSAMIQKAPDGFSQSRIDGAFEGALERALAKDEREAYLLRLTELSRRLEKVQFLEESELQSMLDELAAPF